MSAVGPSFSRDISQTTTFNQAVTISTGDVTAASLFNSKVIRKITVCTGGTLGLQGTEDTAPVPFVVIAGQVIQGDFSLIAGSSNGTAASTSGLKLIASF